MNKIPQIVFAQLLAPNGFKQYEPITGGLSSSGVWACSGGKGCGVLRSWPCERRTAQSLQSLHERLRLLTQADLNVIPHAYSSRDGQSVVTADGSLWDLVSWLDGEATYREHPSPARLEGAVSGIASVHRVWSKDSQVGPSPTIQDRIHRLERWLEFSAKGIPSLRSSISIAEVQVLHHSLVLLQQFGTRLCSDLTSIAPLPVKLHYALRDCHSEHILFQGEKLSGIIDFGAVRIDEPLTDLVRLLGSLEPDSTERCGHGLEIYSRNIGEKSIDWNRFQLMDCAATLLSSLQWSDWLVINPIDFRLTRDTLIQRWQNLTNRADRLLHKRYS